MNLPIEVELAAKTLAQKILEFISIAYAGISFLLWLLQWWWSGDALFMGLVESSIHLLLLPSLFLLPVALLLHSKRLTILLTPCAIAFFISFGVFFLPRAHSAPPALPTHRVATFNIQAPNERLAHSLVDIIRAVNADVVGLQELTPAAAAVFETELRDLYPHQALHPQIDFSGQGILSRYPILSDHFWRYDDLPGSLGHQRTELDIAGRSVIVYNVHPLPPITLQYFNGPAHRTLIDKLLTEIASDDTNAPVLLIGDFNMTDHFRAYRALIGRFTDAYRAVGDIGFGFTFPYIQGLPLIRPFLRLDYVFYDESFRGVRAHVWPETRSADHAPVIAELTLLAPQLSPGDSAAPATTMHLTPAHKTINYHASH